ncbi:hypothetical protein Tco_0263270, partial [Tanacetum coccineum]
TDHILWDIITNGNQTTTDPASPSVSAPKTSLAAMQETNNCGYLLYRSRICSSCKLLCSDNVADLLTKGFDLARFNFLVVTIGMMNP